MPNRSLSLTSLGLVALVGITVGCGSVSGSESLVGRGDSHGNSGGSSTGGTSGTGAAGTAGSFFGGGGRSGTGANGTGASGAGASSGASGAGGPDGSCGETAVAASPRAANVLLVIDESGSMADKPTGFSTDKWSALKTALGSALGAVQNDVAFGLELFPFPSNAANPIPIGCTTNCCELPAAAGINVPVASGAAGVPKILSAVAATGPGGGTPTAEALQRALDYFSTGGGASLKGDKYVLLATDGGPDCNAALACDSLTCTTNLDGECSLPDSGITNCCDPQFGGAAAKSRCLDDAATKTAISSLFTAGIKTFVVGIPGSEVYSNSLDAFAVAGGEVNSAAPPSYFAVSASGGVAGLSDVLSSITKTLITTCRLQLSSNPPDVTQLNVKLDGTVIPQSGPDGWKLDTTTSPPTVVLEGTTCTGVETKGAASAQIVYGCPTVVVPS